jgi:hypothetical protein
MNYLMRNNGNLLQSRLSYKTKHYFNKKLLKGATLIRESLLFILNLYMLLNFMKPY